MNLISTVLFFACITHAMANINPTEVAGEDDSRPEGMDALRVQIFLDEAMFGPGVIDGKPGRFTSLAAQSWNERHGHPVDSWAAVNAAARQAVATPVAAAVVPEVVDAWVDATLPMSRDGQARRKRMSYRSVGEFMAERYHTTIDWLIEMNGASVVRNLKARDSVMVPNVSPFRIESDVTGAQHARDEALALRYVVVDTRMNQLRIFEGTPRPVVIEADGPSATVGPRPNEALIASFPITPGQEKFIRYGQFELRNMVESPWWRYDQQFLDTGKRSDHALQIPPGPNSPIGVIWCGTSRAGIGLHGTDSPETIGRARSAGCIRLSNWDAIRLPRLISPGATIEIR